MADGRSARVIARSRRGYTALTDRGRAGFIREVGSGTGSTLTVTDEIPQIGPTERFLVVICWVAWQATGLPAINSTSADGVKTGACYQGCNPDLNTASNQANDLIGDHTPYAFFGTPRSTFTEFGFYEFTPGKNYHPGETITLNWDAGGSGNYQFKAFLFGRVTATGAGDGFEDRDSQLTNIVSLGGGNFYTIQYLDIGGQCTGYHEHSAPFDNDPEGTIIMDGTALWLCASVGVGVTESGDIPDDFAVFGSYYSASSIGPPSSSFTTLCSFENTTEVNGGRSGLIVAPTDVTFGWTIPAGAGNMSFSINYGNPGFMYHADDVPTVIHNGYGQLARTKGAGALFHFLPLKNDEPCCPRGIIVADRFRVQAPVDASAGGAGSGGMGNWAPGVPPSAYAAAIADQAPGLSYPDQGNAIKVQFGLPADGKQYFGAVEHNGEVTVHDGHRWIFVKYRDPPNAGNTIEVSIG